MARSKALFRAKMRETPFDEDEIALFERLQAMDAKKLAAKVPAWAKPLNPPKTFVFKPNQAPAFPAHIRPNPIVAPAHTPRFCVNGPLAGEKLDLCDEFGFYQATLTFAIAGQVGRYVSQDTSNRYASLIWEPAACIAPK